MKNKHKVEEHIKWQINSGSCSFWWNDWLGIGALAKYNNNISSFNNDIVKEFLINGNWNERKLRQQVHPLIIPMILNIRFQYHNEDKDIVVWKPTESGNFTCTSAWENCRFRRNDDVVNKLIWQKKVPFKMSFLLWRALKLKLPTNENMTNFGVETAKCYCCRNQGWNDVEHIFMQGHFAQHIWNYFANTMGINI